MKSRLVSEGQENIVSSRSGKTQGHDFVDDNNRVAAKYYYKL